MVWANIQPGTWTGAGLSQGLPSSGSYGAIAVGDLNDDGKLDLVAGSAIDKGLRASTGNGAGTWQSYAGGLPTEGSFASVVLVDLNRDGRLDIVAGSTSTVNGVRVYLNNGSGWEAATAPTVSGAYAAIAVGHVDEDGYYDIAGAQIGGNGGVQVWLGSASGSWTARAGLGGCPAATGASL